MWIFPLIFFVCCIIRETAKILQIKTLRIIHVVGYMFAFTYGLLPTYFLLNKSIYEYRYPYLDHLGYWSIWFLWAVVGYVLLQIIYYANNTIDIKFEKSIYIVSPPNVTNIQVCAIVSLFIGAYSLILYSNAYGGIFNLILVADMVRSRLDSTFNPLAFLSHFSAILLPSSMLFLYLCKKRIAIVVNFTCLCVSVFLAVCYLLAKDGRLYMIMYVVLLAMLSINALQPFAMSKKKLLILAGLALVSIVVIRYLNSWTSFIRTGIESDVDEYLAGESFIDAEFAHILRGGISAIQEYWEEGAPYLIWEDIKSGLFAWLPSRFKPNNIVNIWEYNTFRLEQHGMHGVLPTDLITASVYDWGIWGPLFGVIWWGVIIRYVDKLFAWKYNAVFVISYYYLIYIFLYLIMYCSLYSFVLGLFPIILLNVLYRIICSCRRIFSPIS